MCVIFPMGQGLKILNESLLADRSGQDIRSTSAGTGSNGLKY